MFDRHACNLQTPLVGFNFVPDVCQLYYPERLHQSSRGTAEVLAGMVQDRLVQTKQLSALNDYVTSLPSYFGVRIPRTQTRMPLPPSVQTFSSYCLWLFLHFQVLKPHFCNPSKVNTPVGLQFLLLQGTHIVACRVVLHIVS